MACPRHWGTLCAMAALVLGAMCLAGADGLRFDFETGDLQGWQVVEGKFDNLVCDRARFHNQPSVSYNKQGVYFLSTLERANGAADDRMTGIVLSPVFELAEGNVSLLVGGGSHSDTYVALCTLDGTEVLKAHGDNSEVMRRVVWDGAELLGQKVFLEVFDQNRGSWGHVTLDDVQAQGKLDEQGTADLAERLARMRRERLAQFEATRAQRLVERMSEDRLFAEGETKVYAGEYLTGVSLPVGGIGTGSIEINGQAVRHIWHIFNNLTRVAIPNSFFAVRVRSGDSAPVVRALQTAAVGPFAALAGLSFRGEYPFGWFDFEDPDLPVRVSMETFSPLVPLDERNSAIPCAIYNLTAENPTQQTVAVAFLATQQNAVGFTGDGGINGRSHPAYDGNKTEALRDGATTFLHMTAEQPEDAPGYGDLVLAAMGEDATACAAWDDLETLHARFAAEGKLQGPEAAGPSPGGETVDGALSMGFELGPGEKRTVTFVLTWHFPNARHGHGAWGGYGNRYAAWWSDALAVARELRERLPELTRLTRLYHDSFYATNLPHWLLDRISSQVVVLRSSTCFWTRSGYFGGWEGCSAGGGCCSGNCSHVWHYAQAHARLFPSIARAMREQEFRYQTPSGLVPFRQGTFAAAVDGQCGSVLNSYREHLMTADGRWLAEHWPKVRAAMDFVIATWDADEDGVLSGPQHNTLDAEASGSSSWLGSLYLAALAAAEKMALLRGDAAVGDRYRRIREAGAVTQNETLWNGEYYIQVPEGKPERDYGNGCHIDQVLGQWWAHQLDLGWLYPPDRVRTALQSLLKHNFRADFHGIEQLPRKFVDDDDAGLQMITWPKADRPEAGSTMLYADEVMSGFEYSAAVAMVQAGLLREGFAVVRAAYDRYDGRLRTGLSESAWGYSGNPFCDDECGKFYARPMSIWSMLLACQGFVYDGPAARIGFSPLWKPENHCSFFTAARGWGLFTQTRAGGRQSERLELKYGDLDVKSLVFAVPEGMEVSKVTVTVAGENIQARHRLQGGRLEVELPERTTLREGQELAVVLE